MRTKWEPLLEDSAQSRVAVAARDLFVIVQQCITKSSFLLQNHPTQNYDKLIWDNFEQMCKLSGYFIKKKKNQYGLWIKNVIRKEIIPQYVILQRTIRLCQPSTLFQLGSD